VREQEMAAERWWHRSSGVLGLVGGELCGLEVAEQWWDDGSRLWWAGQRAGLVGRESCRQGVGSKKP
jgi:hypothetical protein